MSIIYLGYIVPICEPTSNIDIATLQFVVYTKLCQNFGGKREPPATTHFFFGDIEPPGSGLRYLFNVSCCGAGEGQKKEMRGARAKVLKTACGEEFIPRGHKLGNCAEAANIPLYVFTYVHEVRMLKKRWKFV